MKHLYKLQKQKSCINKEIHSNDKKEDFESIHKVASKV